MVWNVVAAPEFSVRPKVWCFPVAGCVTYRGYFRQKAAQSYADKLAMGPFEILVVANDPDHLETGRIRFEITGGRR